LPQGYAGLRGRGKKPSMRGSGAGAAAATTGPVELAPLPVLNPPRRSYVGWGLPPVPFGEWEILDPEGQEKFRLRRSKILRHGHLKPRVRI